MGAKLSHLLDQARGQEFLESTAQSPRGQRENESHATCKPISKSQ
jgi:hypothetical protein